MGDNDRTAVMWEVLQEDWAHLLEDAQAMLGPDSFTIQLVTDEELVGLQTLIDNARQRLAEKKREVRTTR